MKMENDLDKEFNKDINRFRQTSWSALEDIMLEYKILPTSLKIRLLYLVLEEISLTYFKVNSEDGAHCAYEYMNFKNKMNKECIDWNTHFLKSCGEEFRNEFLEKMTKLLSKKQSSTSSSSLQSTEDIDAIFAATESVIIKDGKIEIVKL